jgi:hypothetical protein
MSNNKQSSIEWLQWALEHTILTQEQIMQTIGLFEQAKEMHKEEIKESWEDGKDSFSTRNAEQYYNETFQ